MIGELSSRGEEVPPGWLEKKSRMIDVIPYLMLPDNSVAQFGDTGGKPVPLESILPSLPSDAASLPRDYPELAYVFTAGQAGVPPSAIDRILPDSGVACFRDRWHGADSYADMIVAHIKFSHRSDVHYHKDDTSFTIYGYKTNILVDSGFYSYESRDPVARYSLGGFAHNVLLIDGKDSDLGEIGSARILDWATGEACSMVRGVTEQNHLSGIGPIYRTFVHLKPDAFLIVDEVTARGAHRYEQHHHFHPMFTEVRQDGDDAFLVESLRPDAPSVWLVALRPIDSWKGLRGQADQEQARGWYFRNFLEKEPSYDLVVTYQEPKGHLFWPVYLEIRRPSSASPRPRDFQFESSRGGLEVRWTQGAVAYHLRLGHSDSAPGSGSCELTRFGAEKAR